MPRVSAILFLQTFTYLPLMAVTKHSKEVFTSVITALFNSSWIPSKSPFICTKRALRRSVCEHGVFEILELSSVLDGLLTSAAGKSGQTGNNTSASSLRSPAALETAPPPAFTPD